MCCLRYWMVAIVLCGAAGQLGGQPKPPDKPPEKTPDKPSITEIGGKSLQQWIKECSSPDAGVRENAVRTIMLFGDAASPAAPALIALLNDRDVSLRTNAAIALAAIEVGANDIPKAVDGLAQRVTGDPQAIVKFHAAVALGTFAKDAKSAIPHLVSASKDFTSWEIRKAACFALGKAGAATKDDALDMRAANALIYALNGDQAAYVRLEAVIALGSMGRPAQAGDRKLIEEALKRASADRDHVVRIWAVVGFMAINDDVQEEALVKVAKLLKNPELVVRTNAARALGTIGSRARSQVPELIELLADKQRDGVLAGIWALASIGPEAYKAVPALNEVAARKDADEGLKQSVKDAIAVINGKKK